MQTVIVVFLVALSLFAGWELFLCTNDWINDLLEGPEDEEEFHWIMTGEMRTVHD